MILVGRIMKVLGNKSGSSAWGLSSDRSCHGSGVGSWQLLSSAALSNLQGSHIRLCSFSCSWHLSFQLQILCTFYPVFLLPPSQPIPFNHVKMQCKLPNLDLMLVLFINMEPLGQSTLYEFPFFCSGRDRPWSSERSCLLVAEQNKGWVWKSRTQV